MNRFTRLCVFCGASSGIREVYTEGALRLAEELINRQIDLIYGGGTIGLMGVLARAVYEGGRRVVGVIPRTLTIRELSGEMIGELVVVDTMHERKARMARLADGFIALPGGLGTMDELLDVMTWSQLGIHRKPIGLLNVSGYFDPLLNLFQHAAAEGFVRAQHTQLALAHEEPDRLLDQMLCYEAPAPLANGLNWEQT